ncbi:MAG TPA: 1,2-phenylacetyl-CoA epoxidase subunit PaaD [Puia sp.]|nr:1,2-phenylacetyl-CoA epoxidase subunit PaaD [Puia sp.]
MIQPENITAEKIWKLLEQVADPEVPVVSVIDLGIIRDINIIDDQVEVIITPTYSGCPAMDMIKMNIRMILLQNAIQHIKITTALSPAWTTDWMSEQGKEKLKAFGIAPPTIKQQVCRTALFHDEEAIQCPKCNSYNTRLISQFGSTACKALYQCNDCCEPFDYFKCH